MLFFYSWQLKIDLKECYPKKGTGNIVQQFIEAHGYLSFLKDFSSFYEGLKSLRRDNVSNPLKVKLTIYM